MSQAMRATQRLREVLKLRGQRGLLHLRSIFEQYDVNGNKKLSSDEFAKAMKECRLGLGPQEMNALFNFFDKDGDGEIDFHEFVSALRGDISPRRRAAIRTVFDMIDSQGTGAVSIEDIMGCFLARNHPDVTSGATIAQQLEQETLNLLNSVGSRGMLNWSKFLEFLSCATAFYDDDGFQEVASNVWHPKAGGASSQGGKTLRDLASNATRSTGQNMVEEIIRRLRGNLAQRGARGIIGLGRKFRILDDDNSKDLSLPEFEKGLRESGLDLSNQEINSLFQWFDRDGSGALDFEEFLQGLKGPMNRRRKEIVGLAFSRLDKDGSGTIEPEELVTNYNARSHPDVLSGKKSEDEVLMEFLDTFDVGGEKDGKVTRNEFENYYNSIGISIDNDDYFELMIRNCWHISGGQGWSANSSNTRVLVTHADGRQTVEEVKDDLGFKQGDTERMAARLREQGLSVQASQLSLKDSLDVSSQPQVENQAGQSMLSQQMRIAKAGSAPSTAPAGKKKAIPKEASAGVASIILRFKQELKKRGSHGITGLARKFRSMDDDGSKSLNLAEFKKALKEMDFQLNDKDCRALFEHFDTDGSMTIGYEEFVQGLRDPLSQRRLELVMQAFKVLDKDGSGVIEPEELTTAFDASKHPEVIQGMKTANQVFREFTENFEIGGTIDGMITTQEFENYYTNVGANIDNDDYFELMIRNCWHISGGAGWSANTSNKRVLVTHKDGHQSVEEVKNDIGMDSSNKDEIMKRLQQQNINAQSISLTDAAESGDQSLRSSISAGARTKSRGVPAPFAHEGNSEPELSISQRADISRHRQAWEERHRNLNQRNEQDVYHRAPPGLQSIISRMREELVQRGARGIIGMARRFKIMDDDGNHTLSLQEFKKAMSEINLGLTDQEVRLLFNFFDSDGSGGVDYEEFLRGTRGPMNERRQNFVKLAFTKLDKDGNGVVEPEELVDVYHAAGHPDVQAGKKTADEVLHEFLDTFDVGGEKDGKVTLQEFQNYYHNISMSIDNDDYFELMMRNCWHISGGTGWCENSSNRRVLVTHADGRTTVEEIKDDLGISSTDSTAMRSNLQRQGIQATALGLTWGSEAVQERSGRRKAERHNKMSAESGVLPGTTPDPSANSVMMIPPAAVERLPASQSAPAGLLALLAKLKAQLNARGARGIIGLSRRFRIMDDDGSKSLSLGEFKKAIKEMALDLADGDLRVLFNYFDKNGDGTLDYEEFLKGVQEPMNSRRRGLVEQAFYILDVDKSGFIEPTEIAEKYDAASHPDVISGQKSENEVYTEFLDTFDVGGEKDGRVSLKEFMNYYQNISSSIDDDDYFELMIRNCWHISGGEGWSQNSSNRRVLVTHMNGHQTVEELNNDLGMAQGDKSEAKRRLQQQGVYAADVSFFGASETDASSQTPGKSKKAIALGALTKPHLNRKNPAQVQHAAGVQLGANVKRNPISGEMISVEDLSKPQGKPRRRQPLPTPSAGLIQIIERLKAQLASRGARGIIGLGRKFRIMDDDGSNSLSLLEFKKAMNEMSFNLNDADARLIFQHFDSDSSGCIDFEEFIQGIRDPLNERRLILVQKAFQILDKDGNGAIEPAEIAQAFDASQHPEVIAGRKTPEEVYSEFLDTFDVGGAKDGKVTADEFQNYYTNVGASIQSDDYFELMMRNCWHISGGEGWCENSSNLRVLVTHADGRQTVEELKDDLGVAPSNTNEILRRLKLQGVADAVGVNVKGGVDSGNPEPDHTRSSTRLSSMGIAAGARTQDINDKVAGRKKTAVGASEFQSRVEIADSGRPAATLAEIAGAGYHRKQNVLGENPSLKSALGSGFVVAAQQKSNAQKKSVLPEEKGAFHSHLSVGFRVDDDENQDEEQQNSDYPQGPRSLAEIAGQGNVSTLVSLVRERLNRRGVRGIVGISRRFKIMDDDNSKSLSIDEFKKGMKECALDLSEREMQQLFQHFDRNQDGDLDYEEFLNGIKGPMNKRRLELVSLAFSMLDRNGNGILEPEELMQKYDATQHPEVLSGKRTANEILQEFLDTFDVGGEVDGKITEKEFQNYYSNVSSSIDNDDYFELMIRNAWHISGGQGQAANSANRRVLITNEDGSQQVVEVRNDLGISAGDKNAIAHNLQNQGYKASSINLTWSDKGSKKTNGNGAESKDNSSKNIFVSPTYRSNIF